MTDLTLIMPFYRNSGMLKHQYGIWAEWPESVKSRVLVIIVDDCSPEPAFHVERPDNLPEVRIYRVEKDMPWHQHGARNLGAKEAPDGWMLLTDMDHVLTSDNAARLLETIDKELHTHTIYMMDRVEADTGQTTLNRDGKPKPHPNSFVVTKELYWHIGGYDEDLCGVYGTDSFFRKRVMEKVSCGHIYIPLVRYWRDLISDSSTWDLPRKEGREPGTRKKIIAAKRARGEENVVKVLQFDWQRVL